MRQKREFRENSDYAAQALIDPGYQMLRYGMIGCARVRM
jgi:hypothetical protein